MNEQQNIISELAKLGAGSPTELVGAYRLHQFVFPSFVGRWTSGDTPYNNFITRSAWATAFGPDEILCYPILLLRRRKYSNFGIDCTGNSISARNAIAAIWETSYPDIIPGQRVAYASGDASGAAFHSLDLHDSSGTANVTLPPGLYWLGVCCDKTMSCHANRTSAMHLIQQAVDSEPPIRHGSYLIASYVYTAAGLPQTAPAMATELSWQPPGLYLKASL